MDYKRILKITAVVLVIIAIGAGIYFFWNWVNSKGGVFGILNNGTVPTTSIIETATENTAPAENTETETQTPEVVTQKLSILINSPVFEYWLGSKDNSLYFANLSGQLIKINSDGSRRMVSSQSLSNLHEINFSADGSLAVAEFNYPSLPTFSVFSASSTSWAPLPAGVVSAAFSPDSKKLAYIDQAALKTLDLAAQKTTEIQKMSQVGLRMKWLKLNEVLLATDPSIESNGRLYSFDLTAKTLRTIIDGEFGLDVNWSKDGSIGIKLNNSERIPKLTLIDDLGVIIANFQFLTVPEKCLIDSSKIYCGVPKNIATGIALPDDYYKNKAYFLDDIYEFDLPTGKITKLFDGNEVAIDARDLKLKDGSLLFINRYDDKVYSLSLQ